MSLRVLFEDNHLLIVVKPPGVPTQGDSSGDPSLLDLAKAYIKERYNKPGEVYIGMVHRLDRPTGGVVALGKTSKAASRLSDQFRQRRVKKTYLAACHGVPNPDRAKLVNFLKKLPGVNRMVVLDKEKHGSQRAELSYRVLGRSKDGRDALLEVDPLTGRQHQIRAQLARIDHPLIFDVKYSNRKTESNAIVPAIGLWAQRLRLTHPITNKPMTFSAWPVATPGSAWEPYAALLAAQRQLESSVTQDSEETVSEQPHREDDRPERAPSGRPRRPAGEGRPSKGGERVGRDERARARRAAASAAAAAEAAERGDGKPEGSASKPPRAGDKPSGYGNRPSPRSGDKPLRSGDKPSRSDKPARPGGGKPSRPGGAKKKFPKR